ncbi:MAG: radical SAM family heme chaperone HemW [Nitriliruptorales bacterium]|nr:radical SAM family heme chaperone HemW [Nitriliruptorales bacterium]
MDRGWLEAPVESGRAAGLGVYVHVPFCAHRCGYCDFATWDDADELMPRYLAALHASVAAGAARADRPVTSVFIGGGTPTRLAPEQLADLVARVLDEHDVAAGAEVTVECNPDDATPDLFAALVAAGVTRVSIGAQSFHQPLLTLLERTHGPEGPARAVTLARAAGIGHVSLDLIYGTPGETDEDWRVSLQRAVATGVDHVSAYALTIHDNTPFGRRVRDGTLAGPDPDVQRRRFDLALDELAGHGFEAYELSNWAVHPDARSRHNLLYWRHGDYLAHGVGAHGHLDGQRWWHHRSLARWLESIETGGDGVAGVEVLGEGERALERLMLGLRLANGITRSDLPPIADEGLESAARTGLVAFENGRLRPTVDGWFLVDEAVRLLSAAP